jgi:hypothetical protein
MMVWPLLVINYDCKRDATICSVPYLIWFHVIQKCWTEIEVQFGQFFSGYLNWFCKKRNWIEKSQLGAKTQTLKHSLILSGKSMLYKNMPKIGNQQMRQILIKTMAQHVCKFVATLPQNNHNLSQDHCKIF